MKNGFTLIEVILVLAVIGILVSLSIIPLRRMIDKSKFEATEKEMENLVFAISGNPEIKEGEIRTDFGYVGDVGELPPSLDALITNPGVSGWRGPYISCGSNQEDFKKDAWGNYYLYNSSTGEIKSPGADITKKVFSPVENLKNNRIEVLVKDARNVLLGDTHTKVKIITSNGSEIALNYASGYFYNENIPAGKQKLVVSPKQDYASYLGETITNSITIYPRGSSPNIYNVYFTGSFDTGN